jgi:hypothetical protein
MMVDFTTRMPLAHPMHLTAGPEYHRRPLTVQFGLHALESDFKQRPELPLPEYCWDLVTCAGIVPNQNELSVFPVISTAGPD